MCRGQGFRLVVLLLAAILAGCTMGPDYERPAYEGPEEFRTRAAADSTVADLPWWNLFEDPVLVAGESGRFAIHVTDLADFSPLTSGEAGRWQRKVFTT